MVTEFSGTGSETVVRRSAGTPARSGVRVVRCDECGAKALVFASTCPQCGHLFDLRDGHGEPLPLAHCTTCDSYYPRQRGGCRWCGTTAPRVRMAPFVWGAVGVAVFAGMVWQIWMANTGRGPGFKGESPTRTIASDGVTDTAVSDRPIVSPPLVASIDTVARDSLAGDTTVAFAMTPAVDSGVRQVAATEPAPPVNAPPVAVAPAPTITPAQPETTNRRGAATVPPANVTAPTRVRVPAAKPSARARPAPARPSRATRGVRWVSATARRWIHVRASASRSSRLVASIGPDTRVQLGESREGWMRIRSRGITGWVERERFFGR